MQNDLLTKLNQIIDQDWSLRSAEDKAVVIKAISAVEKEIGSAVNPSLTRLAYKWKMTPFTIRKLVNDLEGNFNLLAAPKPRVVRVTQDALYPKTGWIGDYLRYTINSEAPEVFHFWTAIAVLGGVFGRNVYHFRGHSKVYPNHFIILVAPSGACRKTSASDIGVSLLKALPDINILAEKITPEALTDAMLDGRVGDGETAECRGFIYAPELGVFLGRQQYNEGLIELITRIADNPDVFEYRTRTQGRIRLTNVNAAMLGCITPTGLTRAIPDTAFGGGFMSRLIFIMQTETDRELPNPPPRDEELRKNLIAQLSTLHKGKYEFVHSPESLKFYNTWYHRLKKQAAVSDDEQETGYLGRKHDHLLRLSMILTLCAGLPPVFTVPKMKEALRILDHAETLMPDAFVNPAEGAVGTNARRIINQLKNAPGNELQHSALLKKNYRYMTKNPFNDCIDTLVKAEVINSVEVNGKRYYSIKEKQ